LSTPPRCTPMIKEYYDRGGCVDCGLPCLGRDCPQCRVTEWHCDICGAVCEDGEDICEDCRAEEECEEGDE
jgi:hypothetical protein